MAWIVAKPSGKYLVRWRDLRGRTRSEQYDTLEDAQIMKDSREREERRANPSRESVVQRQAGLPPSWLQSDRAPVPQFLFENYLRTLIESDKALRETSRETYLHSLKNHIDGTPLGRADIREVSVEIVRDFWTKLDVGVGALRNVYQLLAQGQAGLIRRVRLARQYVHEREQPHCCNESALSEQVPAGETAEPLPWWRCSSMA